MMFNFPKKRSTYILFALLVLILTAITFGSLYEHLYDAFDDKEHLEIDIAQSIKNPSFFFSQERTYLIRPITDLLLMACYLVWENDPRPYHLLLVFFHFITTLLLVYAYRQSGASLELSLIAALLFLMNVAHFRAIHWITCLDRVLALTWALCALISYNQFLKKDRPHFLVIALVTTAAAIFSHPSAISIAPMCVYLAWRYTGAINQVLRQTWHIGATAIVFGLLTYLVSPNHPQVGGISASPDPLQWLQNLLWYMGRTFTAAHWLPQIALSSSWNPVEMAVGAMACLGVFVLYRRRVFPIGDWAIWAILTVLPFLNHPPSSERWLPVGPSRHLYLTTAGTSLVIAWLFQSIIEKWIPAKIQRPVFVTTIIVILYSSILSLKASEAPSFYLSGRRYAAVEDFKTAEDRFLRAIAADPIGVPEDIYPRLAGVALAQGRFPTEKFKIARTHRPNDLRLQALIGISAYLYADPVGRQRGDRLLFDAISQATDPPAMRSMVARVTQNLAGFYHQNKNYAQAEPLYKRAIQIKPDYAMAHYNLGNALNAQGKTLRAIESYRKALAIQPSYAEPLQNLAYSLFEKNELEHARIIYEVITNKMPENATAHYNLGVTLTKLGNMPLAQTAFETARRYAPTDPDVLSKLAEVLYEQERLDPALEIYREITQKYPEQITASYNLAVILIQKGRAQEALELLKNGLKHAPNDIAILLALAFVYEQLEDRTSALNTYKNALSLDASLIEAQQGVERLQNLQHR